MSMASFITLADFFMGRDASHPSELSTELRNNARVMIERANGLLQLAGIAEGRVNSGWRPRSINAALANASPHSRHLSCQAVDLRDADGALDTWCLRNLHALEVLGLWLEHPDATPGWCHVQTVPPRSGRRVFMP